MGDAKVNNFTLQIEIHEKKRERKKFSRKMRL